jgi:hypothetical protein
LFAMFLTPLMAFALGRSLEVIVVTLVVLVLLVAKRLVANWQRPLENEPLTRVLFYRLLVDRDIASREDWVSRRPDEPQKTAEA